MVFVQDQSAAKFLSQNSNIGLHAPYLVGIMYTIPYHEKTNQQKNTAY